MGSTGKGVYVSSVAVVIDPLPSLFIMSLATRYRHWTGTDEAFARLAVSLEVTEKVRKDIRRLGWIYRCPGCENGQLKTGIHDASEMMYRDDCWWSDEGQRELHEVFEQLPQLTKGRFSGEYHESEAFPESHFQDGMRFVRWKRVETKSFWSDLPASMWECGGLGGRGRGKVFVRRRIGPLEQRPVALCMKCSEKMPALFEEELTTYDEVPTI